ncbi:MAG: ABC transporter permease [Bryobacteraceae bacterium]|nr:ABC transporter permease [Bryobacteraceae bacterium]
MWERIKQIIIKEMRQTFREPRLRIMLIVPPMVQLIVFGFAVNLDVDNARMAWVDGDRTPESRELLSEFEGSGRFNVVATPNRESEVQALLDSGEAQVAIQVLPGFASDLQRGRQAQVQILIDGTNSNTASIVSSYSAEILSRYSARATHGQRNMQLLVRGAGAPSSLAVPGVEPRSRVWFNPDLKSRFYFVPGVLVNIIMIVTVMLTAMAIVREKEIGTMEQLMVTPIRPIELILGKTLPFALIGVGQVILITTLALVVFHIPFRGNALLLVVCAVLYLMTTLGAGLFISTISETQQQAMMAVFFFTTPAFMLSGFAFPIANMPVVVQYLTYLNPLRYFMEIVRGIFLKGTGAEILWPQMSALLIYGVTVLLLSAFRFRKTLD